MTSTPLSGKDRLGRNWSASATSSASASSETVIPRSLASLSRTATSTSWTAASLIGSTAISVNRRASAVSDSRYAWYSSAVVAPMQAISPRASAGLSDSARSLTGAAARRWISSKKTTTDGWRTSMRRSSRSVGSASMPAASDSSGTSKIRMSRSGAGTLPSAMRIARPSTMAVLPEPAGPSRIGLRLVRRRSTSVMASNSRSRPTIGPSFPSRARVTRSRPNRSSVGVDEARAAHITVVATASSWSDGLATGDDGVGDRLLEQVDGLVREPLVGDRAVGELEQDIEGVVRHGDTARRAKGVPDAPQDRPTGREVQLRHDDRGEAPGQGRVEGDRWRGRPPGSLRRSPRCRRARGPA